MNNRFILSPRHLLILALFAAAFLRFWQLDSLPPGLYHNSVAPGGGGDNAAASAFVQALLGRTAFV